MVSEPRPVQSGVRARRMIASLALVLAGTFCCAVLTGAQRAADYRFVWALLFAVLAAGAYRYWEIPDVGARRSYAALGLVMAAAQALGYRLQTAGSSGWLMLLCLAVGVCFAPAVGYGLYRFAQALERGGRACAPADGKRVFWLAIGLILLCWLPVFLAYYPGLFAYDIHTQMDEILSGRLTNRNPLLHTLWMGGFYLLGGQLGSYNAGVALAIAVQMLLMAAIFARLVRFLCQLGARRVWCWGTLLFIACFPVHSMLAISCTKDTLFCGVLLLFVMRLYQLSLKPQRLRSKRWFAATAALAALLCLLRNNAFFGLLACVPLGFLLVPKAARLRLTALLVGGVMAGFAVSYGLQAALHAGGISNTEFVSMPSQQLGRVYALHRDELPASVEIEYYLPTVQNYAPHTADPIKSVAVVNRPARMWGFIKLWGRIGLQYPIEYLDAFFLTTQGYWWLDDTAHASIYGEGLQGRQGYLLTDTKPGFGVTHVSLLPGLESLLERLFSNNEYQRVPVLSLLFAPSLYVWLALFALIRAIRRRHRGLIAVSGFLLCYLLPLWLGACVLIRYVYPLMVCMPLLLFAPLPPPAPEAAGAVAAGEAAAPAA